MKFFINEADEVVNEGIEGLLTNPRLTRLNNFPEVRVVLRKDWDKSKVAIISGGGSGHEPTHAGFVGKGMLTAAVCGDIFASPSVDAVLSAIIATAGDKGCLLVIKNYTGDRLNFGLAAEQAREMGYKVETIIVGDDIALGEETEQRGLAGTLFVHKTAGFLSEEGKSLQEILDQTKKVAQNSYSIGLSLEEGQKFQGKEESRLSESEAELGLGIHGEPGVEKIAVGKADELMETAVEKLQEYTSGTEYALILNNLGSVTPVEMNVLLNSFSKTSLAKKTKLLVGPGSFMTSLNMKGFSLSVLELDKEIKNALLAACEPASWFITEYGESSSIESPKLPETLPFNASENSETRKWIKQISEELVNIKDEINALDEKVGDGDAGSTFASAGKNMLEVIDSLPYAKNSELFISIGRIFSREIGGSSGVLFSLLFTGAGNALKENDDLGKALLSGLDKMKDYGGAKQGERTMIDALQPAFEAIANGDTMAKIAQAARKGADATKEITNTKFGRSSYLSEDSLKNVPDPGAEVVARVFEKLEEIQ
ncbi:dihydroxyacetone kinase subunit DhaK [Christiangramia portivictoriae]|uniref:dihydroxyacetone kinase subunit DhaK n=1 Tax=Christiangramia portivictoriae TaxID=326069 RepID=UPI00040EE4DB|nr:dihydroxyacetone kinase subunit DhaK [Christiangramia portivictoriae]